MMTPEPCELLKALAVETRIRIINLLESKGALYPIRLSSFNPSCIVPQSSPLCALFRTGHVLSVAEGEG